MTENKHKVAKTQWRKWSGSQRAMFNSLYEDIMQMGTGLFVHPDTVERKISDAEFSTIAWNAAFLAACHTDNVGNVTEVVAA